MLGVHLECPVCKQQRGNIDEHEYARLAVFLDPAPGFPGKTILNVKCMRHGKVIFMLRVDMVCPTGEQPK